MFGRSLAVLTVAALAAVALPAQQAGGGGGSAPRSQTTAPAEAAQFAFLVGQWEVTVTPKINSLAARIHGSPTYVGTWKAWWAIDRFGVEDELRIMDRSGNPNSLTYTMRFYDAAQSRWTQTALDVYRARYVSAVGEMKGSELVMTSVGKDAEGKSYVQRSRFFDITPTSFSFQADRMLSGERTWDTAVLKIDARRVAAVAPR
jgi:hypothetical protein